MDAEEKGDDQGGEWYDRLEVGGVDEG